MAEIDSWPDSPNLSYDLHEIQSRTELIVHHRTVVAPDEFENATEVDGLTDLCEALPMDQTKNFLAMIASAAEGEAKPTCKLQLYPIALIKDEDKAKQGWHVLLFDQTIRRKSSGSESIIDREPMPKVLLALLRMLLTPRYRELHPIIDIWHGDSIFVTRSSRQIEHQLNQERFSYRKPNPWIRPCLWFLLIASRNNQCFTQEGMTRLSEDFVQVIPWIKATGKLLHKVVSRQTNPQAMVGRAGTIPNLPSRPHTLVDIPGWIPRTAYEATKLMPPLVYKASPVDLPTTTTPGQKETDVTHTQQDSSQGSSTKKFDIPAVLSAQCILKTRQSAYTRPPKGITTKNTRNTRRPKKTQPSNGVSKPSVSKMSRWGMLKRMIPPVLPGWW